MSVSILQNPLRHTVASGVQVNQNSKAYAVYTVTVWAVSCIRWLYGKQAIFHKPPPSSSSWIMNKTGTGLETLLYCCSAFWYSWQPKGVLLQTVPTKTSDCILISIVSIISKNLFRSVALCNVLQSSVCFQNKVMLAPPKPSWRM